MTSRIPAALLAPALLLAHIVPALATARFNPETGARLHRMRLAAGQQHTCAILDDGSVDCWGRNNFGQLGDGTRTAQTTPVPVTGLGGAAISIATGSFHTCAILTTGAGRCWGINDSGQLGNGTTVDQLRPAVVNSFAANVDSAATLHHGDVAIVTALIDDAGNEAHIFMTVQQNGATGSGHDSARCEGRLVRVPMRVVVHGRADFRPGAASAQLEAIVHRGGRVVDDTHWTRALVLSPSTQVLREAPGETDRK